MGLIMKDTYGYDSFKAQNRRTYMLHRLHPALVPPRDGICVLEKLPVEVLRIIFSYILPAGRTIVPTAMREQVYLLQLERHNRQVVQKKMDLLTCADYLRLQVQHAHDSPLLPKPQRPERANKTIPSLLCTSSTLSNQLAAQLYEESTFEFHIHPSGLDFLRLPRLTALEDSTGAPLPNLGTLTPSSSASTRFPLSRLRHVKIVYWAGNYRDDRQLCVRMAWLTGQLVRVFERHGIHRRLKSLTVAFEQQSGWLYDRVRRPLGHMWRAGDVYSARESIFRGVSNMALVSEPLRRLRCANWTEVVLPDHVLEAGAVRWARCFERVAMGEMVDDLWGHGREAMLDPGWEEVLHRRPGVGGTDGGSCCRAEDIPNGLVDVEMNQEDSFVEVVAADELYESASESEGENMED